MKTFKHYALLLCAAIALFGCSEYDDSELKNNVKDLQSRVEKLEEWSKTVNSQISALQGLVTALDANDYVTGVSPILEGAKEVGYTITFKKSGAITIKNGKDGTDGITPIISAKKDTDGVYYWTVRTGDAEPTWMLDADGKKIRTSGENSQLPQLSVAADTDGKIYWKVNGEWLLNNGKKVQATGDKGETGAAGSAGTPGAAGPAGERGDAVFAANGVELFDDYVKFTLAGTDGKTFTLPRTSETKIFASFNNFKIAEVDKEAELELALTIKKTDYKAIKAELTSSAGLSTAIATTKAATGQPWEVTIDAPEFETSGVIKTQPKVGITVKDATEGDIALLKVTIIDANGTEHSSTRVILYSTQVDVESVSIPETLEINVGDESALSATVLPSGAVQTVSWTSNDPTIATIDADGKVKGLKAGPVTITATSTDDPSKTATCTVTVKNIAVTCVAFPNPTAKVSLTGSLTLKATIAPENATIKTLTWSSSNTAVATVSATGVLTPLTIGKTTITVTTTDGNKTATCEVEVIETPAGPQPIVSGYIYNGGYQPQWWHDGKMEALSGASVDPRFMALAGTDVYVAGNQYNSGTYEGHIWKNGTKMNYTTGEIQGIAASGSDLYIVFKKDKKIMVQKNQETAQEWEADDTYIPAGIQVVGADIYVLARTYAGKIKVYKNTSAVTDNLEGAAPEMYVDNADVYVAGPDIVWKNGAKLYDLENVSKYDQQTGLYVKDGKVYVLKCKPQSPREMSLWINGVQTNLTDKIGTNPVGLTAQDGKVYVYSSIETDNKHTLKQWCSEDDAVTNIFENLDMVPRAIVFK